MLCVRYVNKSRSGNVQRQTKKLCYIAMRVHFTDKVFLENRPGSSISIQIAEVAVSGGAETKDKKILVFQLNIHIT